ncbi:dorsal-related immunity factor Dif-like isoform X2 [Bactrocera neohumeralis]|uniref:dorsal-related immunity factor Dif-like isoform X2 n=1 Tax=Bactrocera neohumeralis TaxID=98809 RepID=UPI002166B1FD|nr:dorsal-related immunity factor Dif-like isoform X2 [Bactrocera neohumeralis]
MENDIMDNSRIMDTSEHELSDIIEIISPELDDISTSSKPYLRVVEQPSRKPMRFRYNSEGRTAGNIPGENSFQETKTFPTVEVVGYEGKARILVSCVTKDKPFRQHPHQLVGQDCKHGYCIRYVGPDTPLRVELSNIGIRCVKKKEISESLEMRKSRKIDPFKTGFDHITDPNSIELNSLRLCFQGFIKVGNGWKALSPVVSEPLYDRKAKSELLISRLCSCAATIDGGDEIILLCSQVNKDDVKIRFKAIDNNREVWHAYADFEPSNVHKQTAIAFRTPRYPQADLPKTAKTYIELERPSLDKRSDALEFVFHDPDRYKRERKRRKISGESLINQMNKDMGLNLNYQSISMNNTFNLPVTTVTHNYQMPPRSQLSPIPPQNCNTTPSPSPQCAYTNQLSTLMQDTTIQAANCQRLHDLFNDRKNQELDYNTRDNINTNYHYFGTVRNTTSGGYFERIKEKIEMDNKSDISAMNNTFNLPVISTTQPHLDIKDEPSAAMPIKFTAVEQHLDPYRSNYPMSPQSQLSPMSPQNRNATPSPISPSTNGAYTDQLCTLMQDSTIQAGNCQTLDAIFNDPENQEFDYTTKDNINVYNDNTNYQITNGHYFGTVRNTTSGGCFERINNTAVVCTPVTHNIQVTEQRLQNPISDKEEIERIILDLMQTPLTHSPAQLTDPVQNNCQDNANIDFFN